LPSTAWSLLVTDVDMKPPFVGLVRRIYSLVEIVPIP
jgi:hypothetical protein